MKKKKKREEKPIATKKKKKREEIEKEDRGVNVPLNTYRCIQYIKHYIG